MSKQKPKNVYEFKITLKYIKPKIWRRIQVPENYSFLDLHVAIQDAMGWKDYHLHQFEILDPKTGDKVSIGIPDEDLFAGYKIIPGNKAKICKYFLSPKDKTLYEYDFRDGWEHEVVLEKILPAESGIEYPKCIAGKRSCPPEDCGGPRGYEHFLAMLRIRKRKKYEGRIVWLQDFFDPEKFIVEDVHFEDARERFREAFA